MLGQSVMCGYSNENIEQYFYVILVAVLYKVVTETQVCAQPNGSYRQLLSSSADCFYLNILKV